MSQSLFDADTNVGPGGVHADHTHLTRFPFVLLVDTSHSTAFEPHPDINYINKALADFIKVLREPAPGSQLAREQPKIDVSIIQYSDTPREVLAWTTAQNLPALPELKASGGTATGLALTEAVHAIGRRVEYWKRQRVNCGRGHIIHFTDGAMKDIAPGTPGWELIASKLARLSGARTEKSKIPVFTFLSPKGDNGEKVEAMGREWSGRELITELTGKEALFDLVGANPQDNFDTLVRLTTVLMTNISTGVGAEDAVTALHEDRRSNKPWTDINDSSPPL